MPPQAPVREEYTSGAACDRVGRVGAGPARWEDRRMAVVLFVCLHNAGRSQMSAALFDRAAGGRHRAESAGTSPADQVHPEVVAVMREVNVDLSSRRPRRLSRDQAERADVVVTMGCGDECP